MYEVDEKDPKRDPEPTEQPTFASFWIVAFLDILGYRQLLKTMSRKLLEPPDAQPSEAAVVAATARAIKVRRELVGVIQSFRVVMDNPVPAGVALRPEDEAIRRAWSQVRVRMANFSDTILFYVNMGDPHDQGLAMRHLHTMLLKCCVAQLTQLSFGAEDVCGTLPLRGAIDVDNGSECADRPSPYDIPGTAPPLYSAALATAYELEQAVAVVPRIIVSQQFLTMLAVHLRADGPNDIQTQGNRRFAELSGGLLAKDNDGQWFVDFMGEGVRRLANKDVNRNLAESAWKYVKAAHAFYQSEKANERVLNKYRWLEKYVLSRLPLWDIKP